MKLTKDDFDYILDNSGFETYLGINSDKLEKDGITTDELVNQILSHQEIVEKIKKRIEGSHDIQGSHNHCVECKLKRELKKLLDSKDEN